MAEIAKLHSIAMMAEDPNSSKANMLIGYNVALHECAKELEQQELAVIKRQQYQARLQ
jgi:hypothetical protein